ncbi:MAG: alpha-rhamnosidase [Kiritimatiellae bacterium]|nr:alpha-rhamnosidase [Kiritimatiellia bacterium]
MKSEKMIVAGAVFSFCAAFSALGVSTVAEGKLNAGCEAVWMWYPGEYGIWRGNKLQFERLQWGAELAPFWPSYGFNPVAEFSATFDLAEPEEVEMVADGTLNVNVNRKDCAAVLGKLILPKGRVEIKARVANNVRPPALFVNGKTVKSGEGWRVGWWQKDAQTLPAEFDAKFTCAEKKPGDWKLNHERAEPVEVRRLDGCALFADFGRESYGYLALEDVTGKGAVRVVFAESEKEALDEKPKAPQDCMEWVSLAAKDAKNAEILWDKARGFRYVSVWPVEGDLSIGRVAMERELPRSPRRGAFRCSDERVNQIWDVAADTLELTCREIFVEGIKRDHWVWSGDVVQALLMNYYLTGDWEGCRDTLWCVRGKDPVVTHLNSILDYSFFWYDAVATHILYSGDKLFAEAVHPRMESLIRFIESRLDKHGRPAARNGDWVFIDWAPQKLHNTGGVCAFEMMLLARAYEAMGNGEWEERRLAAHPWGTGNGEWEMEKRGAILRDEVMRLFWDEGKGGLMHLLKNDGTLDSQLTRYPNIFGIKWNYFDEGQKSNVVERILLNDAVMKIQTPYMRFYELEALAALGLQEKVLSEIKSYWGGMLDEGATSFWELYNTSEKGDAHLAMYGRPYGKSLCHAWGASPIYLLGRYFLGVEPTAPGYAEYVVKPNLGGLEWMEGKVPTPLGDIEVTVSNGTVTVKGNSGKGTLIWNGERMPIPPRYSP